VFGPGPIRVTVIGNQRAGELVGILGMGDFVAKGLRMTAPRLCVIEVMEIPAVGIGHDGAVAFADSPDITAAPRRYEGHGDGHAEVAKDEAAAALVTRLPFAREKILTRRKYFAIAVGPPCTHAERIYVGCWRVLTGMKPTG
jgi:hypothetical protein